MLALALLPTVSRALAFERGASQPSEICSVQGAGDVPAEPGGAVAGHLDHCPLCHAGADALGMPPSSPAVAAPIAWRALPALFHAAPRPLFAWLAARPRGPPSPSPDR